MIEFVSGPADSDWGSLRAKMGRSEPWELNYFAIGNEVACSALSLASHPQLCCCFGLTHSARLLP